MRKIFFAIIGFAAAAIAHSPSVQNADLDKCEKNCGIDYGKCLLTTFDGTKCTALEVFCASKCVADHTVKSEKVTQKPHVKNADLDKCEKDCGIQYGSCLVTTFDATSCTAKEVFCAGKCVADHTVKSEPIVKNADLDKCEKNCGIEYGSCILTSFDVTSCTAKEVFCAGKCVADHTVKSPIVKNPDLDKCEKDCGIQYGQCLVTTFDATSCTAKEVFCAGKCVADHTIVASSGVENTLTKVQEKTYQCQQNCGITFGRCLVNSQLQMDNYDQCLIDEASCTFSCVSHVSVTASSHHRPTDKKKLTRNEKKMLGCQKNCALDYGECLLSDFEIKNCTKKEAYCALHCFKTISEEASPHIDRNYSNKSASAVCDRCMEKAFDVINFAKKANCTEHQTLKRQCKSIFTDSRRDAQLCYSFLGEHCSDVKSLADKSAAYVGNFCKKANFC